MTGVIPPSRATAEARPRVRGSRLVVGRPALAEVAMAPDERDPKPNDKVPLGQRLFERPFLLLIAGIVVMLMFYTLWGLVEILSLKPAPLP